MSLTICLSYCSVDDEFPEVVFHFENSLLLNVYPHDYLFQNGVRLPISSL